MDMLFRCSGLGNLMTEPKLKSEKLSETTKKYLLEVHILNKYGRKKDITNNYILKGLLVEEDAISLYCRITKELLFKNEELFSNDFIQGTPDLLSKKDELVIVDTKARWDIWTYFDSVLEPMSKNNYWQLMGYMWLTGAKKARIANCLVDTPDPLINDQKRKFMWQANILDENETTLEVFAEIEKNAKFSDIPMERRLNVREISFDEAEIERLKQRITDCREYITNNLKNI